MHARHRVRPTEYALDTSSDALQDVAGAGEGTVGCAERKEKKRQISKQDGWCSRWRQTKQARDQSMSRAVFFQRSKTSEGPTEQIPCPPLLAPHQNAEKGIGLGLLYRTYLCGNE